MKNHLKINSILFFVIGLVLASTILPAAAQEASKPKSVFQSIQELSEEVPTLTIQSDWNRLIRRKLKEEYQKASFSFTTDEGKEIQMAAKIRTRGNMRKQVCFYPPIKVKFKKKLLKSMGFDTLNKLKLVIQCKKGKIGQSYLFKESFLYEMHQQIGPVSYQTKLIKINVQKPDGESELLDAFLIEEEDEFCSRLTGRVIETGRVRNRLMDREAYLKMVFFQYLILNTDWSMHNKHNIEFIWIPERNKVVPVPYDFDYAGMVGTHYAVPHPSLNINSIYEPSFRGENITEAEALEMADFYRTQKEDLYALLKTYPYLDKKQRTGIKDRMNTFFKLLADKGRVIRNFANAD